MNRSRSAMRKPRSSNAPSSGFGPWTVTRTTPPRPARTIAASMTGRGSTAGSGSRTSRSRTPDRARLPDASRAERDDRAALADREQVTFRAPGSEGVVSEEVRAGPAPLDRGQLVGRRRLARQRLRQTRDPLRRTLDVEARPERSQPRPDVDRHRPGVIRGERRPPLRVAEDRVEEGPADPSADELW